MKVQPPFYLKLKLLINLNNHNFCIAYEFNILKTKIRVNYLTSF